MSRDRTAESKFLKSVFATRQSCSGESRVYTIETLRQLCLRQIQLGKR